MLVYQIPPMSQSYGLSPSRFAQTDKNNCKQRCQLKLTIMTSTGSIKVEASENVGDPAGDRIWGVYGEGSKSQYPVKPTGEGAYGVHACGGRCFPMQQIRYTYTLFAIQKSHPRTLRNLLLTGAWHDTPPSRNLFLALISTASACPNWSGATVRTLQTEYMLDRATLVG